MSVVVLGMHRSGTSLVIGLLELHNYYLGTVSAKTSELKPTGTKEHLLVREINNEILKTSNSDWKNPTAPENISDQTKYKIEKVVDELSQHDLWALKDPRMVFTYKVWQAYLPKHELLYCLRSADKVSFSLLQKNRMPIKKGLNLWYSYNSKLLEHIRELPGPLVEFKNKCTVYLQFKQACKHLGIKFNGGLLNEFFVERKQENQTIELPLPPRYKVLYENIVNASKRSSNID